jgi:hypothetical protein
MKNLESVCAIAFGILLLIAIAIINDLVVRPRFIEADIVFVEKTRNNKIERGYHRLIPVFKDINYVDKSKYGKFSEILEQAKREQR